AEPGFERLRPTANHALCVDSDRDVLLAVEIVKTYVTVRARDFQLVGIAALDRLGALVLDAISLRLIVHERTVEVGIIDNAVHLFFAVRLGIAIVMTWLDFPAFVAFIRRYIV